MRQGDEDARAALFEAAEALRDGHGRGDAVDVARYYAGLSAEELRRGMEDEAAFLALREEVVAAGTEGLAAESWSAARARISDALATLAERAERRADVAPAARAYALLARIELRRAEQASGDERDELWASAEEHVAKSIELFERTGQVTPRLEPLWVRGKLARGRDDLRAARADFLACRDLAERVGNDDFRERALLGLVEIARGVGDVAQVDRLLRRIARFRDPRTCWPLAREHAGLLLHDDRAEAALAFLLDHPPAEAAYEDEWRGMLAAAYLRSGDLASAEREAAGLTAADGEFARLTRATLALAAGEAEAVVADLARDAATEGWSPQGRAEAATLLGEAWLALGRADLAATELGLALDEAHERQRAVEDGAGSVIGEWIGLHALTLYARALGELDRALEAAVAIEDHQTRRLRPPDARVREEELLRWAAAFERGLVTWGVGADASVVAWVAADGAAEARPLAVGRRALESAVRRLREAVVAGDEERARGLAGEIAMELFPDELRAHLGAGGDGARALFLLHGPLEALPLSLVELDGAPLDEMLTAVTLPGLPANDGRATPAPAPGSEWSLFGSPLGEDGSILLPGAGRELAHLARVHPDARVATGAAFVRGALVEALAGDGPLHVATHLVASPGCTEGRLAPVGLQLSGDDVLCAEEVLALGPELPLVVLTACETAGGRVIDAEGTHGVARAFLESGTRNLLVTLWPVADEGARRFALRFHEHLLAGARPSEAARRTRRDLRAEGEAAAEWAAFRLQGRD